MIQDPLKVIALLCSMQMFEGFTDTTGSQYVNVINEFGVLYIYVHRKKKKKRTDEFSCREKQTLLEDSQTGDKKSFKVRVEYLKRWREEGSSELVGRNNCRNYYGKTGVLKIGLEDRLKKG